LDVTFDVRVEGTFSVQQKADTCTRIPRRYWEDSQSIPRRWQEEKQEEELWKIGNNMDERPSFTSIIV